MSIVLHEIGVGVGHRHKQKTYLIGILDDATRVAPFSGFRAVALSENTGALLPVFKSAVMRRGIPKRLHVDNGLAFRPHHLALVCAKLVVTLIHASPSQPEGKGELQRFFRTVHMRLLDAARLYDADRGLGDAFERGVRAQTRGRPVDARRAHRPVAPRQEDAYATRRLSARLFQELVQERLVSLVSAGPRRLAGE